MLDGFDVANFWIDSDSEKKAYLEKPPTDELILEIGQELGYKLPASYIC